MKVIRALRNSVADVNAPVTQDGYIHLMLASLWLKCTGGVADRIQSGCERRNQEGLPLSDRRHRQPSVHRRAASQIGRASTHAAKTAAPHSSTGPNIF